MVRPAAPLATDASWSDVPQKPDKAPDDVRKSFLESEYKSYYVAMRDGVRVAVDVSLPSTGEKTAGVQTRPAIFIQSRYMRNIALRWPFSLFTGGLPVDLVTQDMKNVLVNAGYAIVSSDVRGTGASFGQWRALWSPEEQQDSAEIIDWIVQQPWCSGQVILLGVSYGAGAALFSMAFKHPAVAASVLLYPFWDLYNDISCPGGVPHHKFVGNWNHICQSLDHNNVGGLAKLLRVFCTGVQPVVDAPRPQGSWLSLQYWRSWWQYWSGWREGQRLVNLAVAEHESFDAARGVADLRFTDRPDPQSGLYITQSSACSEAEAIKAANVPTMLVAGWMDATATAAISAYFHTATAPGSQLVVGPWTHGGLLDNSVGHSPVGVTSKFNLSAHIVRFLSDSLGGKTPTTASRSEGVGKAANGHGQLMAPESKEERQPDDAPVHYFTMGHNAGWRGAPSWPPPGIHPTGCTFFLAGDSTASIGELLTETVSQAGRWEHAIRSSSHPQGHSRYDTMTDLRQPMKYLGLADCGHLLFTGQPLKSALEVTGWVQMELWVETCDGDADLFCYLESFDPASGSVAYITEGSFRLSHRKLGDGGGGDPRRLSQPPGLPYHTFTQTDSQPAPPGVPVCCRFNLLPTSYCFAPGTCVRLAISGSDSKHFLSDRACDGSRSLWIRSGGDLASCVYLPTAEQSWE